MIWSKFFVNKFYQKIKHEEWQVTLCGSIQSDTHQVHAICDGHQGHDMPPYFFQHDLWWFTLRYCTWGKTLDHESSSGEVIYVQSSRTLLSLTWPRSSMLRIFTVMFHTKMWPHSLPDLNALSSYVQRLVKRRANQWPHNTKDYHWKCNGQYEQEPPVTSETILKLFLSWAQFYRITFFCFSKWNMHTLFSIEYFCFSL